MLEIFCSAVTLKIRPRPLRQIKPLSSPNITSMAQMTIIGTLIFGRDRILYLFDLRGLTI